MPCVKKSPESQATPPVILPDIGYVRESLILKIFPISSAAWWKGIRENVFPKPVKLGPRTAAWKVADIRALMAEIESPEGSPRWKSVPRRPDGKLAKVVKPVVEETAKPEAGKDAKGPKRRTVNTGVQA